jgi:hypothetical protein
LIAGNAGGTNRKWDKDKSGEQEVQYRLKWVCFSELTERDLGREENTTT